VEHVAQKLGVAPESKIKIFLRFAAVLCVLLSRALQQMSAFDDFKQRVWQGVKTLTPSLPVAHADDWGVQKKNVKVVTNPLAQDAATIAEPASSYKTPPNPGKYEDLTRESKGPFQTPPRTSPLFFFLR
jgi:hypothetical protein